MLGTKLGFIKICYATWDLILYFLIHFLFRSKPNFLVFIVIQIRYFNIIT
jgi:hypothetical protein